MSDEPKCLRLSCRLGDRLIRHEAYLIALDAFGNAMAEFEEEEVLDEGKLSDAFIKHAQELFGVKA